MRNGLAAKFVNGPGFGLDHGCLKLSANRAISEQRHVRTHQVSGTLFVIGTPIGNLDDLTRRAECILKSVDLIAAEDTRVSRKLLNHYNIKTSLTSYHTNN